MSNDRSFAHVFTHDIWSHPADEIRRTREALRRELALESGDKRMAVLVLVARFQDIYSKVYETDATLGRRAVVSYPTIREEFGSLGNCERKSDPVRDSNAH